MNRVDRAIRVMIVAGEASGDMHGADLARRIAAEVPSARLYGLGGPLMAQAGVRLLFNPTSLATVGFVEALRSATVLRRVLLRVVEVLERHRPDVLVLIDFPGFNLRLAEMAHQRRIPVLYYIAPAVWAWGRERAEKVARFATKVACIFPFEVPIYREAGADVEFVGHPLLDQVRRPAAARDQVRLSMGLSPEGPLVALLPGSRTREVEAIFPAMLGAAARLREELGEGTQFVVPVAHTLQAGDLARWLDNLEPLAKRVRVVSGRTHEALWAADLAAITCGTATLEAAILGTPMVAMYRVSKPTYLIGKMLVKIPYVGLPNIVAGRLVVPELIQQEARAERLVEELLGIWRDEGRKAEMVEALRQVSASLGEPGAAARAARMAVELGTGGEGL